MLVLGIILLLVGAAVAYIGRPREQLIFYAGVAIFLVGALLLIIWLAHTLSAEADHAVMIFGPIAMLLRKLADRIDSNDTAVIPPGNYVFWAIAPTPSSKQWVTPTTTAGTLPDGSTYRVDLN